MKNKSNMVYDHLCADCYRKLNTLYRLHDVPLERQRGGRGKCGLCDFRGELTEIEYDRVKDKRSPEERARLRAELNAPPKTRSGGKKNRRRHRRTTASRDRPSSTSPRWTSFDRRTGVDDGRRDNYIHAQA